MQPNKTSTPGIKLRRLRMRLDLTTRDVAELSKEIAQKQTNQEYAVSHGWLVQLENERSVPNIFTLFTLSAIYGVSLEELLSSYVDVTAASRLHLSMQHNETHTIHLESPGEHKRMPLDVNADMMGETNLLSKLAKNWGEIPVSLLEKLSIRSSRFAWIGLQDHTMDPLIRPGSFVQIDEAQKVPQPTRYRSEYDRPIYFIELRSGYLCSWCEVDRGRLISIPHPLSPCRTREFSFPTEAEIVGRVTGVVLRLAQPAQAQPAQPPQPRLQPLTLAAGAVAC